MKDRRCYEMDYEIYFRRAKFLGSFNVYIQFSCNQSIYNLEVFFSHAVAIWLRS